VFDYEPVGPASKASEAQKATLGDWIEAAKASGDFVGVQNYGRVRVDASGSVKPSGTSACPYEPYAPSLGKTVKSIHEATNKPVVVSENGIDTSDDNLRIRYIDDALLGLHDAIVNGVPVLGYFHWSLLDNFEWLQGFTPRYGLRSVDRKAGADLRCARLEGRHIGCRPLVGRAPELWVHGVTSMPAADCSWARASR
jgi:beta-glucosidase